MYTDIIKAQTEILQKCSSLAIDMNKLPLALEALKKTLELDPLNLKSLLLLSNAYLKSSSFINVIHLLITAVNSKSKTILNNIMIWHKLAVSYYRLNRFDDSNHAILQAVSLFEKTKRYKFVMNNNRELLNENKIMPKENDDSNSEPIEKLNTNNNNNIHNNKTKPSTPDNEEEKVESAKDDTENLTISISERKMYLLRCRILLLMDNRHGMLHEGLPAFDKCLYFLERLDNLNYYLDILITRAQFFKKFNNIVNCKNDLTYVLRLLDDRRNQLKPIELLTKVSYTYSLLASIVYEESPNNYNEAMKLIRDGMKKYPHMTSTMKPLSVLETQLIYLGGSDDEVANRIEHLKVQITLERPKYRATTSYMIARLLIKQNLDKNMNEAYECYQKTLKLLPKRPWIWISVGALYLELGQFDDALSTYTQAVNHSLYHDENQSDKSERSFSDESSDSSNSSAYNNLLPAYEMKFNNYFGAIAWFGISQVYTATGEYKNAIDAINQALKLFKIEKDSDSVNKLKALLSKLIILEVNDTGDNSTEQNKNENSLNKQPNILNNPTEDRVTNQNNPDAIIRYEKPEVPMFLLIDLMNHIDNELFKSIETIETEDICSMKEEEFDEDVTNTEVTSIKSDIIDVTSNENRDSRNGKRSRVEWENGQETNGSDVNSIETPYYYANQNSSIERDPYYSANLPTQHNVPSSSSVTTNSYSNYKVPMHAGTYDLRYNFQLGNSYAHPDRIERYNTGDVINDVMNSYEQSQYSSSSHPTPIQTKRQIISMPVFIPDPRQSLPASTINTPVIPYDPNNSAFARPYTAGMTRNTYIHGDPHFTPNQTQVDYSNNRVQSSQMMPISNVGQQMIHQLPTQMQYQTHNIQYRPNPITGVNQFPYNEQSNVNTSNGSGTQSGNLQNHPPLNGNTFYTNHNNPPGSRYYK